MAIHASQIRIPATYMRGGTSKGVFFNLEKLPKAAQVSGKLRDRLLLRIIGSPDPYGRHIDGIGGATSSTSKVVIISRSKKQGYDVDYLFGQVSIDKPFIDWSGNCGNLTAAAAIFSIRSGLVDQSRIPKNGIAKIYLWQKNIKKPIIAHVPITNGMVEETGKFKLDGVPFPSSRIKVDFIDPIDNPDTLFPTGNTTDKLYIPGIGKLNATLINAGIPTIFVSAKEIGHSGTELQKDINNNPEILERFELIRTYGALLMGIIKNPKEASIYQHTPKIAFVSPPADYTTSDGKKISKKDIDLNVRAFSMGKLHHAMMGTVAVATAVASSIPETVVNTEAESKRRNSIVFGHPSGITKVETEITSEQGRWKVKRVTMNRSARTLMEGWVYVPSETLLTRYSSV